MRQTSEYMGVQSMVVLVWLAEFVDFLGGAGPVLFGIALLAATPYLDRLLVRRKRISYRVLYNSRLGLTPEMLSDDDPGMPVTQRLRQMVQFLNRLSIVVIRIRNNGSYDIDPGDFEEPLSFTFGGRVVWNARISEASTEDLRKQLRDGLRFFPTEPAEPTKAPIVAIVVHHVVVNSSVGLTTLSLDDLRKIHSGIYTDWSQITYDPNHKEPIRIIGRGQDSGTRQLFERNVLGTGEGELSSNHCLSKDRNPQAPTIRCERDGNSEIVQLVSTIRGAISYADAPSIAHERRTNALTALTLDGKAFDASTAVESGYPPRQAGWLAGWTMCPLEAYGWSIHPSITVCRAP